MEQTGEGRYVLLLMTGALQTGYYVWRVPADFGIGFRVEKFACDGGDVYDVNLNGRESSCTCKGHTYRDRCKHVEALTALHQAGRL